ncbi:MAG UNVERIFIED_CONTAM: FtsX-like permease family protein [Planctomycetaceae bacterium]
MVVYQILYTEVTNHLPQYATLKAMGFSEQYLLRVVFSQAMMLSAPGHFPGFFMAIGLYRVATRAIQMQFYMTTERALLVFALTVVMCCMSAAMAIRPPAHRRPGRSLLNNAAGPATTHRTRNSYSVRPGGRYSYSYSKTARTLYAELTRPDLDAKSSTSTSTMNDEQRRFQAQLIRIDQR